MKMKKVMCFILMVTSILLILTINVSAERTQNLGYNQFIEVTSSTHTHIADPDLPFVPKDDFYHGYYCIDCLQFFGSLQPHEFIFPEPASYYGNYKHLVNYCRVCNYNTIESCTYNGIRVPYPANPSAGHVQHCTVCGGQSWINNHIFQVNGRCQYCSYQI